MFTYTQVGPRFLRVNEKMIVSLDGIKCIKSIGGVNPHIMIYYFGESEPISIHVDNIDEIYLEIFKALFN